MSCHASHSSHSDLFHLKVEEMLRNILDQLLLDIFGKKFHQQAEGNRLYARYILHKHLQVGRVMTLHDVGVGARQLPGHA